MNEDADAFFRFRSTHLTDKKIDTLDKKNY